MKSVILIAISSVLIGCNSIPKQIGGKAYDEALDYSEYVSCDAASIASILRRYTTREELEAWVNYCLVVKGRKGESMEAFKALLEGK